MIVCLYQCPVKSRRPVPERGVPSMKARPQGVSLLHVSRYVPRGQRQPGRDQDMGNTLVSGHR